MEDSNLEKRGQGNKCLTINRLCHATTLCEYFAHMGQVFKLRKKGIGGGGT